MKIFYDLTFIKFLRVHNILQCREIDKGIREI